jgi:hypothetical protein
VTPVRDSTVLAVATLFAFGLSGRSWETIGAILAVLLFLAVVGDFSEWALGRLRRDDGRAGL